jgi:glycosyltransferase involved in cell wall biosynthesis
MPRAPRFLVLSAAPYRGGAEEYALTIARAARDAGHTLQAAFPAGPDSASLEQDFRALGARFWPLNVVDDDVAWAERGDRRALLRTVLATMGVMLRARPDVVLVNLGWPNRAFGLQIACRLLRAPTAVVYHLVRDRHRLSPRTRALYAWTRRGQRWITVSENNRRLMRDIFDCGDTDIQLIYNGSNPPGVPGDPAVARRETRAELGVPDDTPMLFGVGRLHRQKGIFELARALPAIAQRHPEARFFWAGEGDDREAFCRLLDEGGARDRITLLGHRRDVPRLLLAADYCVLPSLYEGFPFSVLEAAAAGCPLVTTTASSIPELLDDGVHAVLVPPGDPDALAVGVCRALDDPAAMRAMAGRARGRVAEFSEDTMIANTLAALDAVRGGAVRDDPGASAC